jgi:hypothetical protein
MEALAIGSLPGRPRGSPVQYTLTSVMGNRILYGRPSRSPWQTIYLSIRRSSIVAKPKRKNAPGDDTYQLRGKMGHDGLASLRMKRCPSAYLKEAWSPGGKHIIDHERDICILRDITEFLRVAYIKPADIDRIQFSIIAKGHRHNMRLACFIDGCKPAQALALQIFDLFRRKVTHNMLLLSPRCVGTVGIVSVGAIPCGRPRWGLMPSHGERGRATTRDRPYGHDAPIRSSKPSGVYPFKHCAGCAGQAVSIVGPPVGAASPEAAGASSA